ncbi:MAG: peptidylprolyl isomerase [Planctomycetaceae bacterium]|nr:peptidylprolyl isomerase [Planctomycetaceae bacterium]
MIVALPSWLRNLRRRRSAVRRYARSYHALEALESRTLLAGNVTATIQNGNLTLTGDDAANSVEVSVVDGDIVVIGLNSTTINDSSDVFVAVEGGTSLSGHLTSSLGGGDDTLRITGPLTIGGTTNINDSTGVSQVGITDATFDGNVNISTGSSADVVSITGSNLNASLNVNAGGGDNQVSVFDTTVAGGVAVSSWQGASRFDQLFGGRLGHRIAEHFPRLFDRITTRLSDHGHFLFGFAGQGTSGANDVVVEESTLGSLTVKTGGGADDVVVQDSTVNGPVHGTTGAGNDFVMFDGATVNGNTKLYLLQGDDTVVTQNTNAFNGKFWAGGILGRNDAQQTSADTTFGGKMKFKWFESSTVSASTIESRGTGTLDNAAALRTSLNGLDEDSNGGGDGNGDGGGDGGGNNNEDLTLTVDTSANADTVESSGTLVTTLETFNIVGTTAAGATVNVVGGDNGQVDLGTTTADTNGDYSIDVDLFEGGTTIMVTSMLGTDSVTEEFNLHRAVGSVVRFDSSMGPIDVEFLDADAPNTVANFFSYLNDYDNSIIHRSGTGSGGVPSVIQGGGFTVNGVISPVETDPAITNEFLAANSNLEGTLSLALSGDGLGGTDPDSGTSQWFFNLANNAFLDGARHTVFGRIIGTGIDVARAIQALPTFDVTDAVDSTPVNGFDRTDALTNVPLDGYTPLSEAIAGTVSIPANSIIVMGTGTRFTDLEANQLIQIEGVTRAILEVISDTEMRLTSSPNADVTDAMVFVNPAPTTDELVVFSSISVILPAPT